MRRPSFGGLVYSTESGRMCPMCRRPVGDCTCARSSVAAAESRPMCRVGRESKGRGGKTVTVICGLSLGADALAALSRRLKVACGSGGTVKEGVLEIQGDHVARAIEFLREEGFVAKRVGGGG